MEFTSVAAADGPSAPLKCTSAQQRMKGLADMGRLTDHRLLRTRATWTSSPASTVDAKTTAAVTVKVGGSH